MTVAPPVDCEPAWTDDWEPGDHTPGPFELRQAEIRDMRDQGPGPVALWTAHNIDPGSYL